MLLLSGAAPSASPRRASLSSSGGAPPPRAAAFAAAGMSHSASPAHSRPTSPLSRMNWRNPTLFFSQAANASASGALQRGGALPGRCCCHRPRWLPPTAELSPAA